MKIVGRIFRTSTLYFFFLTLTLTVSASSYPLVSDSCCSEVEVSKTTHTSTDLAFAWDGIDGATAYKVWYEREEDNFTSQEFTTTGTSISFTNLPAGTYRFHFVTICGSENSSAIITDDLLMG